MKNIFKLFGIIALIAVIGFSACDNSSNPEPNQTPIAGDYTIGNLSQTAGSVTAVTITAKSGKSPGTVLNVKYNGSTAIPQTAGSYAVTFDVATATGWNEAVGLYAGNLVVNPKSGGNQTPIPGDYNIGNLNQTAGSVTAVTITAINGKSTGAVSNIKYAGNTTIPQTAGTYAVTFDVAAVTGWNGAAGLSAGNLVVNPANSNQTPVASDYTVGNLNQTAGSVTAVTVMAINGKSTGAVSNIKYAGNATIPQTAGTYAVTFDVAAVTGWNEAIGLSAGNLVVSEGENLGGGGDNGGNEPGIVGVTGVFVAGYVNYVNTDATTSLRATLWKDGIPETLSNQYSAANSVYVSGADVYVAGQIGTGSDIRATLWKNSIAQTFSDQRSNAFSVYVSGSDVYVAGFEGESPDYRATLWKNGIAQTLSDQYSFARSVYVSGSDVYVAGYVGMGSANARATLWKNGIEQTLSDQYSVAYSVYVSGSDVYVAGLSGLNSDVRATLWKNGSAQILSQHSFSNSVYVSGAYVYVAGDVGTEGKITEGGSSITNPKPMLWKNTVEQNLNYQYGGAESVYVSGSDVYVAGRTATGVVSARHATLWKNGSAQILSNETSSALSVFVVPDNGGISGGGAIPSTPTGLSAKGSSSSTIDLNWNTVSNATGYNIYRSTSAAGSYVKTGSVQLPPVYNYNLPASTTYYYKITAYNSYGESPQSNYVSATTLSSSSSGSGGGGSVTAGTLTISGCPYTTSNANANVRAVSGSVTSVSSYLSTQASSAAGSGIIATSNTVTWTGTKVPNGTFTIVVDVLQGGSLKYYKASGVSLNNGSGTVSWSSFSQFN